MRFLLALVFLSFGTLAWAQDAEEEVTWARREAPTLPFPVRFQGVEVFNRLVTRAHKENWNKLELGERVATVGKALVGTPYKGFTLEVDDKIEAPSVNLHGLDCWTFFEVSLAFARMLELPPQCHTPEILLAYIELDRYRGGFCDGSYLSRLHYLADWLFDNAAGGMVKDFSRELGGERLYKQCREMTNGWKQYRYLKANPSLLKAMAVHEKRISALPVYHVPKNRVAAMEPQLRNGDVIGITARDNGAFCSHVGLALRDEKGVLHFMHASSNYKKVVIDKRLSDYLKDFKSHAGILVARPMQ
ncbi:MAG: N-acetylmuramoyl-L-alanine amidase-like domain-containing protein [bacterium]